MTISRDQKLLEGLGDTLVAGTITAANAATFRASAPSQTAGFAWLNNTDGSLTVDLATLGLPTGRSGTQIEIGPRTMGTVPGCWTGVAVVAAEPPAVGSVDLYWLTYVAPFAVHGIRPDDVDWWLDTWLQPGATLSADSPWGGSVDVSGQIGFPPPAGGGTHIRIGSGYAGTLSGSSYSGQITLGPLDRSNVTLNMLGGVFETCGNGGVTAGVSGNNLITVHENATGNLQVGLTAANNRITIGSQNIMALTVLGSYNAVDVGEMATGDLTIAEPAMHNVITIGEACDAQGTIAASYSSFAMERGAGTTFSVSSAGSIGMGQYHVVRLGEEAQVDVTIGPDAARTLIEVGATASGALTVNTTQARIHVGAGAQPTVSIPSGMNTIVTGPDGLDVLGGFPVITLGEGAVAGIQLNAPWDGSTIVAAYGMPQIDVPAGMRLNSFNNTIFSRDMVLPVNAYATAVISGGGYYTSPAYPVRGGSEAFAWATVTTSGDLTLTLFQTPWNAAGSANNAFPVASATVTAGSRVATTAASVPTSWLSFILENTGTAAVTADLGVIQWYPRGGE